MFFFFSSRRRHTRCALVTGVQTCALPISDKLGCTLPFDSFEGLRAEMVKAVPALGELGLATYAWAPPKLFADPKGDLAHPIKDFYLTNSICRASPTMQRCSAELLHGEEILERSEEHTSELQSLMRI